MKKSLSTIAALALCVGAFAQSSVGTGGTSGKYSVNTIPLPFTSLAGNTSTNLANGWQSITSYTNVTQAWDSTSAAFIKTTNVVSVTNTVYADFSAFNSRYVGLEFDFNTTDASTTAGCAIQYAKSVTGRFDTNQIYWVTNSANGTAMTYKNVQIDMGGYGYGRITQIYWLDATAGHVLTNPGCYFSTKQGAAQ